MTPTILLLTEAVFLCVLFFLIVSRSLLKNPLAWIADYPPAVIDRARTLGLVSPAQKTSLSAVLAPKLVRCLFAALFFALLTTFVNGAESFVQSALQSYLLWLAIAWFDALVIDCLWFAHTPAVRIPGTEDLEDAYHDYGFHLRMSAVGSLLGIPVCLLSGGLSCLFRML